MTDTFADLARQAISHIISSCKITHFLIGLILLSFLIGLNSCGEKQQKVALSPRPVRFVIAPQPTLSIFHNQTGEIRAHDELTLGFRLGGRLLTRRVEVGDEVKKGELLASLESETGENQFNSARSDLQSAIVSEQVAAANLRRMKILMPSGAIARVQLDNAMADWQSALSHRQTSENALKNAQENLDWTRLTAPAPGVITQVSASSGQVVGAGQTVVNLAEATELDAVFDLSESQVRALKNVQSLNVSLLSDPAITTHGILRDISPQADPQTRTWRVRISLNNPPRAMALGASVQAPLPETGLGGIRLPASSLSQSGWTPAVFIVDRRNLQLEMRPVIIGRFSTREVFISSGIRPGETVVTAGVSKLRQGEKVSLGEGQE
jgi:RND family efflux transporter MFP subunit